MIIDKIVAYDTETNGLDPLIHKPFLHIIQDDTTTKLYTEYEERYWQEFKGLEEKIKELEGKEDQSSRLRLQYRKNRLQKLVDFKPSFDLTELRDYLCDPKISKVAHNAVFDISMAAQAGIAVEGFWMDTVVALHLINEREPKDLAYGSRKYCSQYKEADPVLEWFTDRGITKVNRNYEMVPWDIMLPYGGQDGVVTLELLFRLKPILENNGLWDLFIQECNLIPILVKARRRGFKADIPYFEDLSPKFAIEVSKAKERVFDVAGFEFNLNSSMQLGDFLRSQGVVLPETKKSIATRKQKPETAPRYSTKKEVLEKIFHPAVEHVMVYRKKEKIKSTFIDAIIRKHIDGIVHASLNQSGTVSGRFSSARPNMQNLPKKDPIIRNGFIARDGYVNLYPDYKSAEYVCYADYVRDLWLSDQLMQGADFHQITADTIPSLAGDRKRAKDINFGIIYGMGVDALAGKLKVTVPEAAEILRDYFARFPKAEIFIEEVKNAVKQRGYLVNRFGRRYHLFRGEAYMGVNRLCQGTIADLVKYAMIKVARKIEVFDARIIMMVHDEIITEVHKSQYQEVMPLVKAEMEATPPGMFSLPFRVDMSYSETSWAKAEEVTNDR